MTFICLPFSMICISEVELFCIILRTLIFHKSNQCCMHSCFSLWGRSLWSAEVSMESLGFFKTGSYLCWNLLTNATCFGIAPTLVPSLQTNTWSLINDQEQWLWISAKITILKNDLLPCPLVIILKKNICSVIIELLWISSIRIL